MKATRSHRLKFSGGRRLVVDVTEAQDAVYLTLRGPRLEGADMPRLSRLLWPIVFAYEHDDRPLHITGQHVDYTGVVARIGAALVVSCVPHPGGVN